MKYINLAALLSISASLVAQEPQTQEIEVTGDNSANVTWDTVNGRSYFLQYSTDLQNWSYFPLLEYGDGTPQISYGFSTSSDKIFSRLHYSDIPVSDPKTADFDNDGINNWDEIRIGGSGTLPFVFSTAGDGVSDYYADSNGDGLYDGWELLHYANLGVADPAANNDGDNLDNAQEAALGTSPHSSDSDGDGTSDSDEEAAGTNPNDPNSIPSNNLRTEYRFTITSNGLTQMTPWSVSPTGFNASVPGGDVPGNLLSAIHHVKYNAYPDWSADALQTVEMRLVRDRPTEYQAKIIHFKEMYGGYADDIFGNIKQIHATEFTTDEEWLKKITLSIPANETESPVVSVGYDDVPISDLQDLSLNSDFAIACGDFCANFIAGHTIEKPELLTDLNNDGEVNEVDEDLRSLVVDNDVPDNLKEKGTEYLFFNDDISNGLWDVGDSDPERPTSEKDDDDAQYIRVKPGIMKGEVWLEHPAISALSFYKTRECLPSSKVNLSPTSKFTVSKTNPFPETLYVRADVAISFPVENPQIEGDLVLKIKPEGSNSQEIEVLKMKFTVVKELGAKKYFYAVRDYILENNTSVYIDDRGFPSDNPTSTIRICAMLEERTEMNPFESYHDDAHKNWIHNGMLAGAPFEPDKFTSFGLGISGAIASDQHSTVVINGNQCDFTDTSLPDPLSTGGNYARLAALTALAATGEANLTDKCHGRIYTIPPGWPISRKNPSSSDHDNPNALFPGTHFRGSYLAAEDPVTGTTKAGGKYFGQSNDGSFKVGAGRAPDGMFRGAIGGLSGNYSSDGDREDEPISYLGFHPMNTHGQSGKGVVFVAMGKGPDGKGKAVETYEAVKSSGVPEIAGATPDQAGRSVINLLILDSGDTSCALAHKNPSGNFIKVYEGSKHRGFPYYTNTLIRFKSTRPR